MKIKDLIENTISYAIRSNCIDSLRVDDFEGTHKTFIEQCIENNVQSLIDFSHNKYIYSVNQIDAIVSKLEILSDNDFKRAQRIIHDESNKKKIDYIHCQMKSKAISYDEGLNEIENIRYNTWEDHNTVHIKEGITDYLDYEKREGIITGFNKFDNNNDGFLEPEMAVISARPGVGKTAIIIQMINQMCITNGIPTGIISAEMNKRQMTERCISNGTKIDNKKISKKLLTEDEQERVSNYLRVFYESKLYINDKAGIDVEDIKMEAKKLKKKYGVKILFVDYLQLINTKKKFRTKTERVGYVSTQLKLIAKENEIVVVALAQLNRTSEGKSMPTMSDLKDSGDIEQDADIIIMLNNVESDKLTLGQKEDVKKNGSSYIDFIIGKYREGESGVVFRLRNIKNIYRFENL